MRHAHTLAACGNTCNEAASVCCTTWHAGASTPTKATGTAISHYAYSYKTHAHTSHSRSELFLCGRPGPLGPDPPGPPLLVDWMAVHISL